MPGFADIPPRLAALCDGPAFAARFGQALCPLWISRAQDHVDGYDPQPAANLFRKHWKSFTFSTGAAVLASQLAYASLDANLFRKH